ncbi:MAG: cyclic nucleotide-binding domain-containing protein [Magnetococcales bacterium]|nr:cyclic nucleotide-binding domain-containing protein [Magnetococcales bacterium]
MPPEEQHPDLLPAGTRLRHYDILAILGQGGFGITYRARDVMLDVDVAIKEFFPRPLGVLRQTDGSVRLADEVQKPIFEKCMRRFLEEARSIARFHNENIVRIFSFFKENGTAYLVMEYVEGTTLHERFQRGECRSEAELMGILRPLMKALALLHQEGFVHRDVKPGNIYVRTDGSPVLLDFGSARQFISEQSNTMTTFLTPGYAPLEQYSGKKDEHGPWTDIYSLAAVMYVGISGRPPVDVITRGNGLMHNGKDPLSPALQVGKGRFSQLFLSAIDQALRVQPGDRPRNMDEWLRFFRMATANRQLVTIADTDKEREYVLKIIRTITFFKGFSEEEKMRFVSNHTRIQKCVPGTYIIRENSKESSFFILLSGSANVLQSGNPTPLSELGPGAIFGEISFLTNMPRTANVVANEPCLLVRVDKGLMDTLGAEAREKIKDRIIEQLLKRMKKMNQLLQNIIRDSFVLMGTPIKMDNFNKESDTFSEPSEV